MGKDIQITPCATVTFSGTDYTTEKGIEFPEGGQPLLKPFNRFRFAVDADTQAYIHDGRILYVTFSPDIMTPLDGKPNSVTVQPASPDISGRTGWALILVVLESIQSHTLWAIFERILDPSDFDPTEGLLSGRLEHYRKGMEVGLFLARTDSPTEAFEVEGQTDDEAASEKLRHRFTFKTEEDSP